MTTATVNVPRFRLHHRMALALSEAGLTVDDLAAELAVHRNTVLNYVGGRTVPQRAVLAVWAATTGVPMAWLEHGIEDIPDHDPDPNQGSTQRKRASRWKLAHEDEHDVVFLQAAA